MYVWPQNVDRILDECVKYDVYILLLFEGIGIPGEMAELWLI